MLEKQQHKFKDWYDAFIQKHSGYLPSHIDYWLNNVNKSHQSLRELIKGEKIERFYKLSTGKKAASGDSFEKTVDTLLELMPEYLEWKGFDRDVFKYPTVSKGSHNVVKLSKDITKFISDNISASSVKARINTLLSALGEEWGKAETTESEIEITLSTTPMGFALIGHYAPDTESCFKQGGSSEKDKYVFAQSQNTFVITIAKKNETGEYKNVGRALGFTTKNNRCFNTVNYYFINGFQEGDAIEAMTRLFQEILGSEVAYSNNHSVIENPYPDTIERIIYLNPYGNWSFCDKKVLKDYPFTAEYLVPNPIGIKLYSCPKCGYRSTKDNKYSQYSIIDEDLYCPSCSQQANSCSISKIKTFKSLELIIDENGNESGAIPEYCKDVKKCFYCQYKCMGQEIDGKLVCYCCIDNFTTCDYCNKAVLLSDTLVTEDGDVCKNCTDQVEMGDLTFDEHDLIINDNKPNAIDWATLTATEPVSRPRARKITAAIPNNNRFVYEAPPAAEYPPGVEMYIRER